MMTRRRRLLLPALIGLFVFSFYVFTAPNDLQNNGDTWLRYQTTQSLVDDGHIYVTQPRWTDKRMVNGVDNKLYTIYDPGQIVAMAPLYVVGKFLAHHVTGDYIWTPIYTTHLLDDIFGALLAIVFFLLALRLGYSRRVATVLTAIYALATVAWPDAESMLEHTQVTFFLALSVLCSLIFVQRGLRQRVWVAAASLSLGCAFLTRYDTGILYPLIPLYLAGARLAVRKPYIHAVSQDETGDSLRTLWHVIRRPRTDLKLLRGVALDWAVYLAGAAPAFAAAAVWNYARFGSVTKTGIPPTFGEPILQGLAGLTLSPGKGLLWYMPILFLLPFAVRQFYAQHRLTALLFAGIVVVELLLFSSVIYWHGDPAWGPRYIYPTVPFLVLPLGVLLERWGTVKRGMKAAVVGLVALSLGIQVIGTITPQYRFWYKEIHAQLAAHQGFNWGYKRGQFWYFYYWNIDRSPILVGAQNLYEITALRLFGQKQYELSASPIPSNEHLDLANPVHSYEINNYNLWWLATYAPFAGTHRDGILAAFWFLLTAGSLVLVVREVTRAPSESERIVVELRRKPA